MKWSHYFAVVLVALTTAAAWRYRDAAWLHEFLNPQPAKKLHIEFDNGTVRQYETPASGKAKKANEPLPVGAMRKCVRGGDISYTNNACPVGSIEQPLSKGTITVLSAPPTPPKLAPAPPAPPVPEPTLRQKSVDRALNQ